MRIPKTRANDQKSITGFFTSQPRPAGEPAQKRQKTGEGPCPDETDDIGADVVETIERRANDNFIPFEQLKRVVAITDVATALTDDFFARHERLEFTAGRSLPPQMLLLQRPVLDIVQSMSAYTTLRKFFGLSKESTAYDHAVDICGGLYNTIVPLCIFGEAEPRGKGGKWPSHKRNKAVWDALTEFSVTFFTKSSGFRLRVHASQKRGVCVQDIILHRYNPASLTRSVGGHPIDKLKNLWMPWDEAKMLADNLGMDESLNLLWESQALAQDASFPRMLSCGECRRPVGRSESAILRHFDMVHCVDTNWKRILACEKCLLVFFYMPAYTAHMDEH
jgi:hypothetical protein